jgi:uncharacterized protein (DUF983 family)
MEHQIERANPMKTPSPVQSPTTLPRAMWRGFLGKCPNCGKGHLFARFLKVDHHCEVCGEEFFHHQADDFPAYLVIVLVGHIVVPMILAVETAYSPPVVLQLLVWLPVTLFASLALLQPVKGAVVGLQWQTGMHGFDNSKRRRSGPAPIAGEWIAIPEKALKAK